MLKCQDRSCSHTQPENPDAFSERRMSRQERAPAKVPGPQVLRSAGDQNQSRRPAEKSAGEKIKDLALNAEAQRRRDFFVFISLSPISPYPPSEKGTRCRIGCARGNKTKIYHHECAEYLPNTILIPEKMSLEPADRDASSVPARNSKQIFMIALIIQPL